MKFSRVKIAALSFTLSLSGFSKLAFSQRNNTSSNLSDSVNALLEMEALDKRKPVPLSPTMALHQRQSMREHLEVIQSIVGALAKEDFKAVEQAVKKIGYSKQMEQMCTHMGAGADGFTELAIQFHKTADTIGEAARLKDQTAVLSALSKTLQTCTSCHAQFRQKIVDRMPHMGHEAIKN